jgi:hypothetical protein
VEYWAGPEELSFLAMVKQNEPISACIERSESTLERTTARAIVGSPGLAAIANDRVLHCLMVSTPICDVALESANERPPDDARSRHRGNRSRIRHRGYLGARVRAPSQPLS